MSDADDVVEMNDPADNEVTIPIDLAFTNGQGTVVVQDGDGKTKVKAAAGVTLNGVDGGELSTIGKYDKLALYKSGDNAFIISGREDGSFQFSEEVVISTPGANTFTKANYPGLRKIEVQILGAGGAGGGADDTAGSQHSAGAGGGAGEYAKGHHSCGVSWCK